jgi:transposase InsO family protein
LYLQQFSYKVTHIKGKDNSADALSRLPVGPAQLTDAAATKVYACSLASQAIPSALTPKEVELASERDPTLKLVREAVTSGDWSSLSGTMYKALSDEIWVLGQIVMRGNRIILPESLWKQTLSLAHEGHQGITRTKARLREKVWWPNMDKQVEQLVKACYQCQLVGPRTKPEPIRSTKLPEGPWNDIAADLLEIPGGNHLLVVIDNFSRWPEVVLVKKTDAQHIITAMEGIFRTHGLPQSIRTDNGPPFASKEFESFLQHLGIEPKKGIPYWPQSNGEVERCNQTILKAVRIANLEGTSWKIALENFLFQYRTTPHSTTGLPPAKLLMGRTLRDKLPRLTIPEDRATEAEWQQRLRERDALNKLRQKEYADKKRSAEHSIIEQGDDVLLKQTRENKLDTNFESMPYKVIQKEGNSILLENHEGVRKMRNIAHVKKTDKTFNSS